MRSASAWLKATIVAPVSTTNCTGLPLMLPPVMKWPPGPAVSTICEPVPSLMPPPRFTGAPPSCSGTRLPASSTTASLPLTLTTLTPCSVAPTATMRGVPSMTSSALSPMLPLRVTVCAAAPPHSRTPRSTRSRPIEALRGWLISFPEVGEGQRCLGDVLADQGHRALQIVALGAGDAHHVALDGGLHLQLALLDERLDLLRGVAVDAVLHRQHLLDLVAADLLDLRAAVDVSRVDAALGQLGQQDVHHLADLEIAVGVQGELLVLLLDARRRALEVEAGADLLGGLVDGVLHFDEVGFEHGIEAGHGKAKGEWRIGENSLMRIESGVNLKPYNTFGLPAVAQTLVRVTGDADVRQVVDHPQLGRAPKFVLGGGSNIVLTRDMPQAVLKIEVMGKRLLEERADDWVIEAGAGENWHEFVMWTLAQGYAGLENLALIP